MNEYNKETVKSIIEMSPVLRIGNDEFIDLREVEFEDTLVNLDHLDQSMIDLNLNGAFISTNKDTIIFVGKPNFEETIMRYLEYNSFYNVMSSFKLNDDSEYVWYIKANV